MTPVFSSAALTHAHKLVNLPTEACHMTGKTTGREGPRPRSFVMAILMSLNCRVWSRKKNNLRYKSREVCVGVNSEPPHLRFDPSPVIIGATLMRKANARLRVWPSRTRHAIPRGCCNRSQCCLQDVRCFRSQRRGGNILMAFIFLPFIF